MQVEGAIALVTGANRGLGKAYAEVLIKGGAAKVYAASRDVSQITDGRVIPIRLDVTSPAEIATAARSCPDVTLLVNNAGIMLASPMLTEKSPDALRQELEVNVFGVLAMASSFAPILAHNGGGAIINMLSVASWFVNPFNATYCASKHAALAVTNALRNQLKAQGTQVIGVYAGFIDTDMAVRVDEPKTSPRQVAERALAGLRTGEDHVLADQSAHDIRQALLTDSASFEAEMQKMWADGDTPWSL